MYEVRLINADGCNETKYQYIELKPGHGTEMKSE